MKSKISNKITETISASPIVLEKSVRRDTKRVLTSCNAGKIVPVAYVPLLREDRLSRGQMRINVEMMETAEMLANPIMVNVYAHLVPHLAMPQFYGMDSLNRSFKGVPDREGETVIPYFNNGKYLSDGDVKEIYRVMGLHAPDTDGEMRVNSTVVNSYNEIVNFRRRARSSKLPQRNHAEGSLARAFWHHNSFSHIVPDFDEASIDGEVPLNIITEKMPIHGLGVNPFVTTGTPPLEITTDESVTTAGSEFEDAGLWVDGDVPENHHQNIAMAVQAGSPKVFAELQENGITVSLANIELAKKTAAFAALRDQYHGIDDDHIVDILMQGVRVPEEQLAQPILLDKKSTIIGYNRRYATDSGNLDESVTSGETFVDLVMRTPSINAGGVIMITLEIVPEQLWERQEDAFFNHWDVEKLPQGDRDLLDPQKVSIVKNSVVDVKHTKPEETFGYAPLNYQWKRDLVNIGGKYFRPDPQETFKEDRQKIWASETIDPSLTEDFYLVTELNNTIFSDFLSDTFEITARGGFEIVGNTQFGKGLQEDNGSYDAVLENVDTSRVTQESEE